MRGHLQERGEGSWRIKIYVGRSPEGRKRYVQRTVRGSRREAEREMARLIVEVDEGRHAAAAPLTFGELLDRWLAVKRLAVGPSTVTSYERVARKYLRPALGERKVAALRPMELDTLYAELRASGLSARTVRICHTVVRQSLEQARKWGLIARSPAVDATPPPQTRKAVTPPTVAEVQLLLSAARDDDPEFGAYLRRARGASLGRAVRSLGGPRPRQCTRRVHRGRRRSTRCMGLNIGATPPPPGRCCPQRRGLPGEGVRQLGCPPTAHSGRCPMPSSVCGAWRLSR